jgi:hypothetical protein
MGNIIGQEYPYLFFNSQFPGYNANFKNITGQTFLIFFPVGLIVRSSLNS